MRPPARLSAYTTRGSRVTAPPLPLQLSPAMAVPYCLVRVMEQAAAVASLQWKVLHLQVHCCSADQHLACPCRIKPYSPYSTHSHVYPCHAGGWQGCGKASPGACAGAGGRLHLSSCVPCCVPCCVPWWMHRTTCTLHQSCSYTNSSSPASIVLNCSAQGTKP